MSENMNSLRKQLLSSPGPTPGDRRSIVRIKPGPDLPPGNQDAVLRDPLAEPICLCPTSMERMRRVSRYGFVLAQSFS